MCFLVLGGGRVSDMLDKLCVTSGLMFLGDMFDRRYGHRVLLGGRVTGGNIFGNLIR